MDMKKKEYTILELYKMTDKRFNNTKGDRDVTFKKRIAKNFRDLKEKWKVAGTKYDTQVRTLDKRNNF